MSQGVATDTVKSDEEKIEKIYRFAAERMRNGSSDAAIRKELQSKGLDADSSRVVLEDLAYLQQNARKDESQKLLAQGVVWLVGGIAVAAMTYSSPSSSGTYVIAWGAIIFGGVQLVRGLGQSRTA